MKRIIIALALCVSSLALASDNDSDGDTKVKQPTNAQRLARVIANCDDRAKVLAGVALPLVQATKPESALSKSLGAALAQNAARRAAPKLNSTPTSSSIAAASANPATSASTASSVSAAAAAPATSSSDDVKSEKK